MFNVPDKRSIPELETDILAYWKKHNIFERSVSERSEDNLYIFYDGPPFVSGLPHYGHLLGSIAKDIVPRYWTMKGKRVERVWGWDAHGLPVENSVQKILGIENRRDIEEFGIEAFVKECYKYTSETSSEWHWYIDKIGRWVDMDKAYKTMDQTYMESVIWAFKEVYDKGLIYEDLRTSLFCTTCGTPVSNFEIAMDNSYKEVEDPSIIVAFPVITPGKFKGINILAWTTTPWTMPSNRGLVVDRASKYVVVSWSDKKYIVAKARFEPVFAEKEGAKIETEFSGRELIGLEYEPPYKFFKRGEKDFFVYEYEGMVNMEDGTGIVHSAPGFGEIDSEMGAHYGLTMMLTIDDEGKFIAGDDGENPYEGFYYKKADKYVLQDLEERGLLFSNKTATHRFPFHDRCDTWLIQKAQKSWFVNIQDIKEDMLKNNEGINWVPEHLKHGRFKDVVETSPDWCISRNRFWATPMPVWRAEDGDTIVIGSIAELEELSGQKVKDLHRPYIDEITIEKNGKVYTRIPEVLDVWFDSGSMPYAQMHYPFENKEKFERNFPGDYIVEYIAQVRAWFNVMHRLSTALFNSRSFTNVVTTGVVAGNDGRKMSKTFKNFPDPKGVLENIGGDPLRLYLMNSPLMNGENTNIDESEMKNKSRNVLNPFWHSLKFFLIYAEHFNFKPAENYVESADVLDRWVVTRLHETIKTFSEGIEAYHIPHAVQSLEEFVDDLSRWYVRRSRDRISEGDQQALQTFYYVLNTFSKVAAPAIPFMAEAVYQELNKSAVADGYSVHLESFPEVASHILEDNAELLEVMKRTRDIVSAALSVRVSTKIGVRQPLAELAVDVNYLVPEEYLEIIKSETNVKTVTFVANLDAYGEDVVDLGKIVALDTNIPEDLEIEGQVRSMIRSIQSIRKEQKLNINDSIKVTYPQNEINDKLISLFGDEIKKKVVATEIIPGDDFSIEVIPDA